MDYKKILVMFLFIMCFVRGQHQTEIIPYRLVPSQDIGYGCWLEIEFIGMPVHMRGDEELMEALYRLVVSKETGEIGFNQDEFKILDLDTLLTPGRNNGVHSMLKKVKFYSRKNADNPKSNEAA